MALNRALAFDLLLCIKTKTVIGIIGNTHGVKMAAKPAGRKKEKSISPRLGTRCRFTVLDYRHNFTFVVFSLQIEKRNRLGRSTSLVVTAHTQYARK